MVSYCLRWAGIWKGMCGVYEAVHCGGVVRDWEECSVYHKLDAALQDCCLLVSGLIYQI
jgi:hypothetical protein